MKKFLNPLGMNLLEWFILLIFLIPLNIFLIDGLSKVFATTFTVESICVIYPITAVGIMDALGFMVIRHSYLKSKGKIPANSGNWDG